MSMSRNASLIFHPTSHSWDSCLNLKKTSMESGVLTLGMKFSPVILRSWVQQAAIVVLFDMIYNESDWVLKCDVMKHGALVVSVEVWCNEARCVCCGRWGKSCSIMAPHPHCMEWKYTMDILFQLDITASTFSLLKKIHNTVLKGIERKLKKKLLMYINLWCHIIHVQVFFW